MIRIPYSPQATKTCTNLCCFPSANIYFIFSQWCRAPFPTIASLTTPTQPAPAAFAPTPSAASSGSTWRQHNHHGRWVQSRDVWVSGNRRARLCAPDLPAQWHRL